MRALALAAALALLAASAEARTFKGTGPRTLAAGYGAAWVGHGDGTIMRIDAGTLERRSRRLGSGMGGFSISSLATGFRSVWVTPNGPPLHRLDPGTARVTGRIWRDRGGWSPTDVSIGAGAVWVTDHRRNTIFRFDPRRRVITGRTLAPHTLRSVVASTVGIWVQTIPGRGPITGLRGARIISRLDPITLRLRRAFRLTCEASLLPAVSSVWVLDHCDATLRRFDVRAGTFSPPLEARTGAAGLTSGFGSVWVAAASSVLRIDPVQHSVVARIRVEANAVAAGAGFVWVLDSWNALGGGRLQRIDPATNRVVGDPIRL